MIMVAKTALAMVKVWWVMEAFLNNGLHAAKQTISQDTIKLEETTGACQVSLSEITNLHYNPLFCLQMPQQPVKHPHQQPLQHLHQPQRLQLLQHHLKLQLQPLEGQQPQRQQLLQHPLKRRLRPLKDQLPLLLRHLQLPLQILAHVKLLLIIQAGTKTGIVMTF